MLDFLFKNSKIETSKFDVLEEDFKLSLKDNCVVFAINEDEQLTIRLSIQNLKTSSALKMAEVLFLMSHDCYKKQLVEMLKGMAEDDPGRAPFITELVGFWAELVDKYGQETYYKDDSPLVSPSKFSQLVMNSEGKNE